MRCRRWRRPVISNTRPVALRDGSGAHFAEDRNRCAGKHMSRADPGGGRRRRLCRESRCRCRFFRARLDDIEDRSGAAALARAGDGESDAVDAPRLAAPSSRSASLIDCERAAVEAGRVPKRMSVIGCCARVSCIRYRLQGTLVRARMTLSTLMVPSAVSGRQGWGE